MANTASKPSTPHPFVFHRRTEGNGQVQNKSQALSNSNTRVLMMPTDQALCWAPSGPHPHTRNSDSLSGRPRDTNKHRTGVPKSRPPATAARTPGFILVSVSPDPKAENRSTSNNGRRHLAKAVCCRPRAGTPLSASLETLWSEDSNLHPNTVWTSHQRHQRPGPHSGFGPRSHDT